MGALALQPLASSYNVNAHPPCTNMQRDCYADVARRTSLLYQRSIPESLLLTKRMPVELC